MSGNHQPGAFIFQCHIFLPFNIVHGVHMKSELPDVQAGFRKGRGTRDQIANILWIIETAREHRKTYISALLTVPKPLTLWITIDCGKS